MEAVPKMPMLSFSLKQTLQKSSFSRLKQVSKCVCGIISQHKWRIAVQMTDQNMYATQHTNDNLMFFSFCVFAVTFSSASNMPEYDIPCVVWSNQKSN